MTNVDNCEIDSEKAFDINAYAISHFKNDFNGTFIQLSTDFVLMVSMVLSRKWLAKSNK